MTKDADIQLLKAEGHDLLDAVVKIHRTTKSEVYRRLAKSMNVREEMAHFSKAHFKTDVFTAAKHLRMLRKRKYWNSLGTSRVCNGPAPVLNPPKPIVPRATVKKNHLSQAELNRLVKGQKPLIYKRSFLTRLWRALKQSYESVR